MLKNCEFSENNAKTSGGGVAYAAFWPNDLVNQNRKGCVVDGCLFRSNTTSGQGGGMSLIGGTHKITNSRFTINEAILGGGLHLSAPAISPNLLAKALIAQCVFFSNSANYGGGFLTGSARSWVINSTFANNGASHSSGGMQISSGSVSDVENSIFYGNVSGKMVLGDPFEKDKSQLSGAIIAEGEQQSMLNVSSSCIQYLAWYTFNANTGGDPKFIDQVYGDLRIDADSAAIDAGNNYVDLDPFQSGFQLLPQYDLTGNSRLVDGNQDADARVDMGAYEYQGK